MVHNSPANISLVHLTLTLSVVGSLTACSNNRTAPKSKGIENAEAWTITELRADHGHDIMESEDGGMYHNYFCAVVLKRNGESVNLLYENEIPDTLNLEIGDRYLIEGLDTAAYSDNWNGHWLHDVQLTPVVDR